jgi:hypothetical protein
MTSQHVPLAAVAIAIVLSVSIASAAGPYPPYPPYPPPPPRYYAPPIVIDPTPPPLSPLVRAIYAPFYAAGLVVRYGVYYLLVAPFEVFGRTVAYGVEGGVGHPPPTPPAPPASPPPAPNPP